MKIKDILAIIEQNEEYKRRIERYKMFPEKQKKDQDLEQNYKKKHEMEKSEEEKNR